MGKRKTNLKKGSYGVFSVEIEAEIESAIQQVLDEDVKVGDIGNEPLFRFCQYAKGVLQPSEAPGYLFEPFIRVLYQQHGGLQALYDFGEVMLLFEDIWDNDKVEHPKMAYLKIALRRAEQQTAVRPEIAWASDPALRKLDNVCYELQRLQGEKPIFISQYQAAEIIDKSNRMGRLALDKLERMKNLLRHRTGNAKKRISNSYFYVGQAVSVKKTVSLSEIEQRRINMIDALKRDETG